MTHANASITPYDREQVGQLHRPGHHAPSLPTRVAQRYRAASMVRQHHGRYGNGITRSDLAERVADNILGYYNLEDANDIIREVVADHATYGITVGCAVGRGVYLIPID